MREDVLKAALVRLLLRVEHGELPDREDLHAKAHAFRVFLENIGNELHEGGQE